MTRPTSGALIAIGGAEDRTAESAVLKRVLDLVPAESFEVGVITTASRYPADAFSAYLETFEAFGARAVHHLDVPDRVASHDLATLAILEACGLIFITGGDQLRLTNVLGGSPFLTAVRERHAQGAVVAGTSAGAAALTATMIYDGAAANALRKGAVKMAAGLAFARGIVIDSHFLPVPVQVREGMRLSELPEQDSYSFAVAQLWLGADDEETLLANYARVLEALPFRFSET